MPRPPLTQPVAFFALVVGSLGLAWLGMMATHELGHVVAAWLTGGHVRHVELHPLRFSRTDVSPNPYPGWVVWGGPILGVLIPLSFCGVPRLLGKAMWKPALFFAGFCLIVNGAYLALGSFDRIGDCDVILETGSPPWTVWLFGASTVPMGFVAWHKLGQRMGTSPMPGFGKCIGVLLMFIVAGIVLVVIKHGTQ